MVIDCVYQGTHTIQAPIGPQDSAVFEEVYAYAKSIRAGFAIYDEESLSLFRKLHPETEIKEVRGDFEYCWYTSTLAELKGKPFVGIRGQINHFLKTYTYTVESVTAENLEDVRMMVHQWGAEKETCDSACDSAMLHGELQAVDISLDHYDEFQLEGLIIRIDGCIGAIVIWENFGGDVALVHYEKGLKKFLGIYKIINWETAKYLKNKYKIISRESDVDNPGLREAKLRYHPDFFIKAYLVGP